MKNYQVLPLKYRPQTLDEIWVQDHIKTTLKRAIESNRIAHAYLFAGPRGVGKTTTARILAKSLNCMKGQSIQPCQECSVCQEITSSASLDVLEIDGASNRGIDQVRELRENVKFMPTSCPYKIYIIDEVHMLTNEAFNALLKTLEEPPHHVIFIFATTAPQKVPATILSRCQRFYFRKARVDEIIQRLTWICKKENIDISEEALYAIGKRADGAIRDAESMLDQLRVFQNNQIELKDVEDLLGVISQETFFGYTELLIAGDQKQIIEFIDKVFSVGYDFIEFYTGLLEHFRLLQLVKLDINKNVLSISQSDIKKYENQAKKITIEQLMIIMQIIADNEEIVKRTLEPKILFEILSLNLLNSMSGNPGPRLQGNNQTKETADINTLWRNLISEFSEKRPFLSNHLETAIISDLVEGNMTITFKNKSDKDYVESERNEIERYFTNQIGKPVKVSFLYSKEEKPDSVSEKPTMTMKETKSIDTKQNNDTAKAINNPKISLDTDMIFKQMFPDGKKIK